MSNLTVEKLEEILEEKLQKAIQPLSKQIEDALQSVNALNTKYEKIAKSLKDLDEAKKKQIVENASLKAELLKSSNEIKLLKKSLNNLEQYTRRDCLQVRGIPLPSISTAKETHSYNTRFSSRMTYALPKTRTNYGIFNIRYQGAKIWTLSFCHLNNLRKSIN